MDMSISASTSVSIGSDWVEGAAWLVDGVGSDIARARRGMRVLIVRREVMKASEAMEVNVRRGTRYGVVLRATPKHFSPTRF